MSMHRLLFCCLILGLVSGSFTWAQEPGQIQEIEIPETAEHGTIHFGIVLPPSYGNSTGAYPVIFYLHGLNRYYLGPRAQWIASFFTGQFNEGNLPECITIFLDGEEGYWCDHYDGDPLIETELINFLIPFLDKHYRTNTSKRLIMGYSMGGNGAVFFYSKYPELFAASASLDGGIVSYEDYLYRTGGRPEIISDEAYFLEYGSPYGWVKRNNKALREKPDTSILLTAGFIIDANKEFLSLLEDEEIPVKFVGFGYDHEFGYVFSESKDELLQFIAKRCE